LYISLVWAYMEFSPDMLAHYINDNKTKFDKYTNTMTLMFNVTEQTKPYLKTQFIKAYPSLRKINKRLGIKMNVDNNILT
jgi:hypothetical protein